MENKKSIRAAAVFIAAFLILVTAFCLLSLATVRHRTQNCIADIYQNGQLILSIPLYQVQESYAFDVEGEDGCVNRIEVRPGSIGVVSADCPDHLCVKQGFIESPVIPIACLPNRLVICLRSVDNISSNEEPDAVTY